jgi:hypothetical protein
VDLWLFATIDERFYDLEKHRGLKDRSAQWTNRRVIGVLQTSQVAKHTGIREVDLRCLDQAFADVGMVRP